MILNCQDPDAKPAWHPCCRRIVTAHASEEILAALGGDLIVAWLTGAGETQTVDIGKHRIINGPLPSHREPAGDLLHFDVILVTAAATGADKIATDIIPTTQSIEGVCKAILDQECGKQWNRPLYGLVLAGGKSSRMGRDKADLEVIVGEPQAVRAAQMLEAVCSNVCLSVRPNQQLSVLYDWDETRWPLIRDSIEDAGPMAGILSAQRAYPHAAWLVVACDLPNLSPRTLSKLTSERRPLRYATAFNSTSDGFPEPLCAIYEPKSQSRLFQFLATGFRCPRRMLINSRVALIDQDDPNWLTNMNHPEEFHAARSTS